MTTQKRKPASKKHWSQRLDEKRRENGWGWRELARRAGVPHEALYKWSRGDIENPEADRLEKVAAILGVSRLWLLHGIDVVPNEAYDFRLRRIPLLQISDVGNMLDQAGWSGPTVVAPDEVGPAAFALVVPDHALQPDGILPGDIIVIDPDIAPMPGKPVAALVGNPQRAVLRKLRQLVADSMDGAELTASHPDYATETIKKKRGDMIVGAATHHIRRL